MALREPPLAASHDARGAKTTAFGGWEMPVEFDSIRTEHASVRESVGKFDVSHMGQIEVSGPDATELLDRLTTNDVATLDPGDAQYAMVTDSAGTILDDTMIYCLPDARDAEYLFVPNAGHDEEMEDRWVHHREEWDLDVTITNRTEAYALIAIQGPDASEHVVSAAADAGTVSDTDAETASDTEESGDVDANTIHDLSRFTAIDATIAGIECLVARTGYTGEDGFELLCPWADAATVWETFECQPCGLGARDTLRTEAGLLLSGHEFDPEENPRNPYEADVGFAVDLDTEFVGRDALAAVADAGPEERLVGFELEERGVPRQGYEITDAAGESIGTVTSGTMSPTLSTPIGLGYVPTADAEPDTEIAIRIRGEPKEARIRALPFL